jgi:hypothetical protein
MGIPPFRTAGFFSLPHAEGIFAKEAIMIKFIEDRVFDAVQERALERPEILEGFAFKALCTVFRSLRFLKVAVPFWVYETHRIEAEEAEALALAEEEQAAWLEKGGIYLDDECGF